jgi:hypothetical protein
VIAYVGGVPVEEIHELGAGRLDVEHGEVER